MQSSPFGVPGKREDQLVYRRYSRDSVRMLLWLDFGAPVLCLCRVPLQPAFKYVERVEWSAI